MTKQLNIAEQEDLFTTECKLINLKYEYQGYTGKEKWAIVSELSEKELFEKYPDVISRYTPFVLLSVEQGEVIAEAKRNDDKYEKRSSRTLDVYGYEDDITESFHKELITDFEGQFDLEEKARLEREAEQKRTCDILKVRKALSMLQPIQRQRLLKFILEGKCYRQIATEEGTYHSSVSKSIEAAIKNFKKFFENL